MRFGHFITGIMLVGATAAISVSCLKGTQYESSYQLRSTFEDFDPSMADDEFWGPGLVNYDAPFLYGDVAFNSATDEGKSAFTGFAVSQAVYDEENPEALLNDGLYSVNCKTGSAGSATFAVFCDTPGIPAVDKEDFHHIVFMMPGYGSCTPVSCMVNNTKYVADRIAEYRETNGQIEMKLTATGYASGAKTGSSEILLASNAKQVTDGRDSTMCTWTKLDLSALGNVDYIDFTLSFSDGNQTTIPQSFCLDDFYANIHILVK